MNFDKVRELARKHLLKSHLKIEHNLLRAEKLFIVNSALNWVFKNTSDPKVIRRYVIDLEKFLRGDVELKWLNEYLLKESRVHNDYKEKSNKEIIATSGSK